LTNDETSGFGRRKQVPANRIMHTTIEEMINMKGWSTMADFFCPKANRAFPTAAKEANSSAE
jgi:hypothetical protein